MKRQDGPLGSITSWFLETEADTALFCARCSQSEGYLGYYKGQKWWGWFSSSKRSYLRSMCFCLWKYRYAVLPCKSTSWLHPHLHSKKMVRTISQQPCIPFLRTILTTETFSLCWSKISISDTSTSDLCDPHLLQNRLYSSEKGLSLALGYMQGFFRK